VSRSPHFFLFHNQPANIMKILKILPCVLGSFLVLNSPLLSQNVYYDLNVGTAVVPDLRVVNWGPRTAQTSGTWGVSSESFLGFTLTSLINSAEAGQLSWAGTAENSRALGVGGDGSHGSGWGINRNNASTIVEAIQLNLPAENGLVGVIDGPDEIFLGLRQIAFDRLNVASGALVTISGFVADPEASWAQSPFTTPPTLTYNAGTLSFETLNATDWTAFGLLQFDNLSATLSDPGVSLVFSNNRNTNNANAYGLVGWQYAVVPELSTYSLISGLVLFGCVLVRRSRARVAAR
jgi:hypothetical protein